MASWRYSNFYFFYYASVGVIVPFWSLYLDFLEFTAVEIGELTAILVATKILAPYFWGAMADRIRIRSGDSFIILKWATAACFLVYCFMYLPVEEGELFFARSQEYWLIATCLLGFSIFWNASIPPVEAATLNHLGSQRHRYGAIRLWGSVGFIFAVVVLGYLLDYYSPKIILHAGALTFFTLVLASFILPRGGAKNTNLDELSVSKLLNYRVVTVLALCVLMQMSHAPFYTFFSIYLQDFEYSKSHIGWLWAVGVVFEILVFLVAYRLLRQYRLMHLLSFTLVVAALRWLLLASFPEVVSIVWFTQVLHAITYGLHHSVMMQLIDQFFQGRYQVRGQALYLSLSFGLGGALGSFTSGYLWDGLGASTMFYFAAGLMLVASLISVIVLPPQEETLPIREM